MTRVCWDKTLSFKLLSTIEQVCYRYPRTRYQVFTLLVYLVLVLAVYGSVAGKSFNTVRGTRTVVQRAVRCSRYSFSNVPSKLGRLKQHAHQQHLICDKISIRESDVARGQADLQLWAH